MRLPGKCCIMYHMTHVECTLHSGLLPSPKDDWVCVHMHTYHVFTVPVSCVQVCVECTYQPITLSHEYGGGGGKVCMA